jgi:feruloyl esterase
MTAQRYPEDYDGILCGAPANNRTHLHAMLLWNYQAFNAKPGMYLTPQQADAITEAVLKKNAGKDGGHPDDKFLTDPRLATFDPDELNFLTKDQKEAMKKVYAGPVNPSTGEPIHSPITLGSEYIRVIGLLDQQDSLNQLGLLYPFRWVFGFDFDPMKFDFDKDMTYLDSLLAPVLNATDPNLKLFKATGGKMLMYAGASDPLIPFEDAIQYYDRVIDTMGGLTNVQDFYRCFVVPGLWHNNGGPGPCNIGQRISDLSTPSESNVFTALIHWVENGIAPEQLVGATWDAPLRMPVYLYPKFPHLINGQKPGVPESYEGVIHERGKVTIPATRYLR